MAHEYPDDDQNRAYDAGHYDQHMEERSGEVLEFHVQDSLKKALVKALRPFVQPIFNFGARRFGSGSGNPTLVKVNNNEPSWSSSYHSLEQFINAILNDHKYEAFKSHKATPFQTTLNTSDESNSSDSDDNSTPDKTQGKRKHKTHHAEGTLIPPRSSSEGGDDLGNSMLEGPVEVSSGIVHLLCCPGANSDIGESFIGANEPSTSSHSGREIVDYGMENIRCMKGAWSGHRIRWPPEASAPRGGGTQAGDESAAEARSLFQTSYWRLEDAAAAVLQERCRLATPGEPVLRKCSMGQS
ncbi:hypothetical protein NDU88_001488 [Pleurodeles waltl]|uniref:Uncharacterized protein n=1 Tax=Pleurodeles waltl TaxID=8319 RepID=A0AAV7NCR1_PLEWA|nr:hypothetical protein NDU88_001488 [Pleurodeles waltl]